MKAKRIAMSSIKTLTFHQGQMTASRRTEPIPQLTCVGAGCRQFEAEVVQCSNVGDDGSGNYQWKCDTDIPSSLRLGKVEVSCEGWTSPGDKYVLQGSCGLTYNLHPSEAYINHLPRPTSPTSLDKFINSTFNIIFFGVLITLLYSFIRSLLLQFRPSWAPPPASSFFPWGGGGGGHDHGNGPGGGGGGPGGPGGGGGGGPGFNSGPPPPYTKHESSTQAPTQQQSTGPGFWTGLAAGGAAAYLAANRGRNSESNIRDRFSRIDRWDNDDRDRGVGSSTGQMRRATGFGGTSNR